MFYPKFFDTDVAGTKFIKNPKICVSIVTFSLLGIFTWKRLLIRPRWAPPDLEDRPVTRSPLLDSNSWRQLYFSVFYHQDIVHWLQKPPQLASRTINLKMFWAEIQRINRLNRGEIWLRLFQCLPEVSSKVTRGRSVSQSKSSARWLYQIWPLASHRPGSQAVTSNIHLKSTGNIWYYYLAICISAKKNSMWNIFHSLFENIT